MNRILIAAAIAVAIGITGWIIGLNVKLSAAKAENIKLTTEIQQLQAQLTLADAAIIRQNDTLNIYRAEADNKTVSLANDYERLNKKYQLLAKKSADKLGNEPTCEDKLRTIYESQEAFCYER